MIEPHDLVPGALVTNDVEARNWFNACGPPRARGERQNYMYPFRSNLTGCDGGGVVSDRRH